MGSTSVQILAENDGNFLGCKGGKELFCLFWRWEMGKCTRLPWEFCWSLGGLRGGGEDSYNLCYVFPHSFARYKANQHEFKFILSVKWCSEIGIHEPPMFMMPKWPTENSHLWGLKFYLPLTATWRSMWAPQAVPVCQRQRSLAAALC